MVNDGSTRGGSLLDEVVREGARRMLAAALEAEELIALEEGYRESSEAWAGLLRDCARRGMRAPVVVKLIESAQARRRAVNAPHLVVPARAGARFERGHLVERPEGAAA